MTPYYRDDLAGITVYLGDCKRCGEERTFPAYPEEHYNGKPARHQQPKLSPRVFGQIWEA